MAGVRRGLAAFDARVLAAPQKRDAEQDALADDLDARVVYAKSLTDDAIALRVRAPLRARRFRPGNFIGLQAFAASGERALEPLAMTGCAATETDITFIARRTGGATDMMGRLAPGAAVSLMGPTGAPTALDGERVALIGRGVGACDSSSHRGGDSGARFAGGCGCGVSARGGAGVQ